VETLLSLADPARAHLLLPRLGEPLEPAERRPARPWWRNRSDLEAKRTPPQETRSEDPVDPKEEQLPWPLD
jgi:hypothetical protein